MSSSGHHVGRNALWSVLNQSASQILVLIVFLVNARFIPKEDFGAMAIAMLVVEFFRQMIIESIGTTLLAKPAPDKQDYNAGFILVTGLSILSAIIVYSSSGLIADVMGSEKIGYALEWICLILLTFGLSRIHEAYLSKNMQFKKLALRSIFSVLVGGGVGIYMATEGYGLLSLIVQQLVTTFLSCLFLCVTTDWVPKPDTTRAKISELFHYAKHIATNNLSYLSSAQADVFLSGYFLGPIQTGVYNAAKRVTLAATLIVGSSIGSVSLPTLSSALKDNDHAKLEATFLGFVRFSSFLTAPIFSGMACLAFPIVAILLGDKWLDAAPALALLAPAAFFTTLGQFSAYIILAKNKPLIKSLIAFGQALSGVVLLILMAPYGVEYAALAYTLNCVLTFPVTLFLSLKIAEISFGQYWAALWPSLLSSALMSAAVFAGQYGLTLSDISLHPVFSVLVFVPIGALIYLASMWIFNKPTILESVHFVKASLGKRVS